MGYIEVWPKRGKQSNRQLCWRYAHPRTLRGKRQFGAKSMRLSDMGYRVGTSIDESEKLVVEGGERGIVGGG